MRLLFERPTACNRTALPTDAWAAPAESCATLTATAPLGISALAGSASPFHKGPANLSITGQGGRRHGHRGDGTHPCGAIKGAIDNVELGDLTGLLAKIRAAVQSTAHCAFVDAVARKNVELAMAEICNASAALRDLEAKGAGNIAGAM